jgi:hypothetical protein
VPLAAALATIVAVSAILDAARATGSTHLIAASRLSWSCLPLTGDLSMLRSRLPRLGHRLAAVVAASLVLATTACDDDDPVSPPAADGTYLMSSIEQQGSAACTLGATGCTLVNTGTEVIVVDDGTLALAANGTFTLVVNGSVDSVDEELGAAAGTWVRTASGVTLNIPGLGVPLTGTFTSAAADELEFIVPGSLFSAGTTGTVTIGFDRQ